MSKPENLSDIDLILMDIGRKCADDVSAAIRRNLVLPGNQRGAMIVASYGAAAAIGAANGSYSAFMGGTEDIDETLVDELWASILRPMIVGDLRTEKSLSHSEGEEK